MLPWKIQEKAVFIAAINVFPLLEIREAEMTLFSGLKHLNPAELRRLQAKEIRHHVPYGPDGYWARWYQRHIPYRPHRLDEVFVEWMSAVWVGKNAPGYLTVISSGPYGGLCAVFWNDMPVCQEKMMPFQTLAEAKAWAMSRPEICQGASTSLGKA
ncbi:hypothetical protein [Acidithiobacillus sp.]|uniref:hypothetical protein n=1 Tax=Acidithiobacillus sp. TaxID=1872118 RepID=UPI002611B5DC|nr:hypothetical protein [Acidithiobacillus sp.]MDD2749911.1 hypothetical protein [Acidithiobacillus sp.]MDD5280739.1 hypothetical protein [Acidithiobacillus sp.]